MFKRSTQKFSTLIVLLAGLCLIGSAFHVHQLHPDYDLRDGDISHHFTVDQPDCIACLHIIHASDAYRAKSMQFYPAVTTVWVPKNRIQNIRYVSKLRNKSPPFLS